MSKAKRISAIETMVAMTRREQPAPKLQRMPPTPEREMKNHFRSAGMARKLIPVIDTLHNKGVLTEAEWRALNHYRDQASLADKSPMRSCCDNSPRGGNGPGVAIVSALIETGRIERDLGQLMDIARAVAVDDISLTEWCIAKHGGREKDGAIVPRGKNNGSHAIEMARMELRMAAHRIVV